MDMAASGGAPSLRPPPAKSTPVAYSPRTSPSTSTSGPNAFSSAGSAL